MKMTTATPTTLRTGIIDFASWFQDNLLSAAIQAEEIEAQQAA